MLGSNVMTSGFQCSHVPQGIQPQAAAKLAVFLGSQIGHSNVHAWTTPSPDTQTSTMFVIVINSIADLLDVTKALVNDTKYGT